MDARRDDDPAATAVPTETAPDRHGFLRNGGYVFWIALLLVGIIIAWRLAVIVGSGGARAVGDGHDPTTYGFDLSTSTAPPDTLIGAGKPKDGLPAINGADHIHADDIPHINETMRGKYLVSSDRVIGLAINGDACCWPVRVLQWHEVVNDTVGGVPVLVSWSSYTDTAVVLERRVPPGVSGMTLEFGYSGLLSNAVPLVYDRRYGAAPESLWNPLLARAVAGPAAESGVRLRVLHTQLVTWAWWRVHHPATRVLVPPATGGWPSLAEWVAGDDERKPHLDKRYGRDPFQNYYTNPDKLPAPVAPLPPTDQPVKERLLVVESVGADGAVTALAVIAYRDVEARADADGVWMTTLGTDEMPGGPVPLRLTFLPSRVGRPCVAVEVDTTRLPATADLPELRVRHAFRFAWHATQATSFDPAPATSGESSTGGGQSGN